MEIILKNAREEDSELWDKLVDSTSHGTLFHRWKWLKIAEKHTNSKLYPLIIYRGTTILGLYPIFLIKKGFINTAFSPPPYAYLLYLGPLIMNYEHLKQDKKEGIFIESQKEIDRFLFSELKCKYVKINSTPGLFDCRPFIWCGYQVIPRYTYHTDLSKGIDYVWEQFDRKLRVDLNRAEREGVTIEEGNKEDLELIHGYTNKRFREQGLELNVDNEYLIELFEEFFPKNMKIFIANYKGKKIGGMISLLYKNKIYLWEGISKTGLKGIAINDMAQWNVIKWGCNNGFNFYDSMDSGNNPRFRSFKSKYNPELEIWFTATKYSSFLYRILDVIHKDILLSLSRKIKRES